MYRLFFVSFVLLMAFSGYSENPLPKHWHESGGFACGIKAGLDGEVYRVTNLKNSGPGSIVDAVSKGNRLVVFDVGGVIDLKGDSLVVKVKDITIAGITAPSPGITLIKGTLRTGGSNIVVSHITCRLGRFTTGKVGEGDAADIYGSNIVYDHVEASWGVDEGISMYGAKDVTLYKTMVSEGLSVSIHEEGEHSKGSLIRTNTTNVTMIGTLYAFNALRSPRLHSESKVALINGVIYGWFPGADDEGSKRFNYVISMHQASMSVVGVVAMKGPESIADYLVSGHKTGTGSAYMEDNIIIDQQGKALKEHTKAIKALTTKVAWPQGVVTQPAHESLYEVLRTAGPRPAERDAHTTRVIKHIVAGTGKHINNEDDVGGWPNYPETRHSQPLTVPDGFEARRAWLDKLEDEVAVDTKIDLTRLYKLVGTEASDKYRYSTSINKQIGSQKAIVSGITLSQRNTGNKQLLAKFTLSAGTTVSMKVFDLAGNLVVDQPQKYFNTGNHKITANIQHLPVGHYVCRFQTGNTTQNISYTCY